MLCWRTLVTAGDHIDWMTTSPETIRLTLWLNSLHNALNCPAFSALIRTSAVWSSSLADMLPVSL